MKYISHLSTTAAGRVQARVDFEGCQGDVTGPGQR
jgi:hypothetical protein